jgi:hypothetical protein
MPPGPPGSGRPPSRSGSEPAELFDLLEGEIPDADEAASASERARAASFAELIDKAIAGRTPPALSADERALLEVTTVIRAAAGHGELGAAPRRAAVEHALASALDQAAMAGQRSTSASMNVMDVMDVPLNAAPEAGIAGGAAAAVTSAGGALRPGSGQHRPAARRWRWAPWALAGTTTLVAAAAVAALWLRASTPAQVSAPAPVPVHWRSRPADALIGEIRREAAGDAAARLDSIYSDRLDGYREATLFRPRGAR